jgi:hypothetical protein
MRGGKTKRFIAARSEEYLEKVGFGTWIMMQSPWYRARAIAP